MSRTALVGYTGFVGSSLLAQRDFDVTANSANVGELEGQHFSRVVWSAAKAEKWRANADPEADRRHIDDLIRILRTFTADEFVLISTVDVYGDPVGVDESTPIATDGLHAYGLNRYRLEEAAREIHGATVVRLPALYGTGLKKNVLYDLLHDNQVDRINPRSSFQYYGLDRLGADLDRIVDLGIDLANLATEPVTTARIAEEVFGIQLPDLDARPGRYDVRTGHEALRAPGLPYIEDADTVLQGIARFVESERVH